METAVAKGKKGTATGKTAQVVAYDTAALVIHAPTILLLLASIVVWLEEKGKHELEGRDVEAVESGLASRGRSLLAACKVQRGV
jgi:hypothetical protein